MLLLVYLEYKYIRELIPRKEKKMFFYVKNDVIE